MCRDMCTDMCRDMCRNMGYINELFVCSLRGGTLLMAHAYAAFGVLKGVSGRGEEAQNRAAGPH